MKRAALLLVLLGIAVPAGAPAQIAPGYSGSSSTTYGIDATEFWRTIRGFGACFAKEKPADALALIATAPDSKEEAAVFKRISRGESQTCLTDTSLRVPVPLIRGAIAEGLYKRGVAVPAGLLLPPPAPGMPIRTLGDAARCYTAAHRDEVRALLAETAAGSKKERAALDRMAADFWLCLPKFAQKRGFNPTQIRFRLAETLLRIPAPAAAAAGEER